MQCLLQQQGPQWACLGLESWEPVLLKAVLRVTKLALALLCSSVVFLE